MFRNGFVVVVVLVVLVVVLEALEVVLEALEVVLEVPEVVSRVRNSNKGGTLIMIFSVVFFFCETKSRFSSSGSHLTHFCEEKNLTHFRE